MKSHVILIVSLSLLPLTAGCQTSKRPSVAERASCSSLCQLKQPTDVALSKIAGMGYRYVDLSALSFAKHIDVQALLADFDAEASRVEDLLDRYELHASNLTYDSFNGRDWDQYQKEWTALVKLADRLDARLINIMAPPAKADREEAVRKLRVLNDIAAERGIILTIETHSGQLTEFPADAVWLCEQVPGMGLTLDPSHYYAGPNQGKSFDEVYPYVKGTGLRAGGMNWQTIQSPWGEGVFDFVEIIRKLEAQGYDGYYVVEYLEGFNDLDAVEQSKRFLAWIQSTDFDGER